MTSDRAGSRQTASEAAPSPGDLDALRSRAAALRQAASLLNARHDVLLEAALAELDAAIAGIDEADSSVGADHEGRALRGLHSDRRLLHAVFTSTPAPLFVVDLDGTVLRANAAACDLLGVGPGYATGRSIAALVEPPVRAALRSQFAAADRTAAVVRLRCGMLAGSGVVKCELEISPLAVRGDAAKLLVTVSADDASRPSSLGRPAEPEAEAAVAASVVSATRRLDLLSAAARLLLKGRTVSESVLLQRAARLVQQDGTLAAWAVVDVDRRGQLRRHYVAGPDDPTSANLVNAVQSADPCPGSIPHQVYESGQTLLSTHIDDDVALGRPTNGAPLLTLLGGVSVLAAPMSDGSRLYGVLTLIRRADDGQFSTADAALAEEIGALLGLSIASRRTLRERTLRERADAAEALRASLLPPVLMAVPGVEMAYAHLAPTRGREVGGDFYDAYPTPGGWGIAIGDVCGKGEHAAAVTAAARHAIRVLAHSTADPADVLRRANELMLAEDFGSRFVTASAAHLSWRDGHLRIVMSNAGHPAPFLIRPDGKTEQVPGGGLALGVMPDAEPGAFEIELTDGDVLFYYTDGLSDARNSEAIKFDDSLADNLAEFAGRRAADIVSDMQRAVLEFSQNVLLDDLSMLVLRVGAAPR